MLFPFFFAQFSLHPAAILPNPVGHWLSVRNNLSEFPTWFEKKHRFAKRRTLDALAITDKIFDESKPYNLL